MIAEENQTSEALSPGSRAAVHPDLSELSTKAWNYIEASRSPATVEAYRADWARFVQWCDDHQLVALPADPETVAMYVADLADRYKPATIARRLAAVGEAHRAAGYDSPTEHPVVRQTHRGVRRHKGVAPTSKTPLRLDDLQATLAEIPSEGELADLRDRALLLVGFFGALRRSELVALDVENLTWQAQGVVLRIRSSKTDQQGHGRQIGIPTTTAADLDAPAALRRWLISADIDEGPAFRPLTKHGTVRDRRLSAQSVNLIVKQRTADAGLLGDYGAHSLRSGLATSAAEAGVAERSIMNTTGHQSERMVRRYIDQATVFDDNAAVQLLAARVEAQSSRPGTVTPSPLSSQPAAQPSATHPAPSGGEADLEEAGSRPAVEERLEQRKRRRRQHEDECALQEDPKAWDEFVSARVHALESAVPDRPHAAVEDGVTAERDRRDTHHHRTEREA